MDIILLIVVYILSACAISWLAYRKGLKWFKLLLVGLFLTPFASAILYANTNPIKVYREKRYKCSRCKYYFTENHPHCPHCLTEGYEIILKTTWVDMT